MAANENVMGAPTEGLGQTVTFAFNVPGAVQQQIGGRGQMRGGVQGSAGGATVQAAQLQQPQQSAGVALLLKSADKMLAKGIENARTTAYVTGMQRAMMGEAVEDIANEQPAWARVFGDSDAVEGARAYGRDRQVQNAMLDIERAMPDLKKLGPNEANAFYVERVKASLTGNAADDAAIMQALQRHMPQVMKRQASEHYGWLQERAVEEEAGALSAGAARLQEAGKQLASGKLSPEDFLEQSAQFANLAVPAEGRDLKFAQAGRLGSLKLMAESGQFHALNAVENSGLLDILTPQQRAEYVRHREANERQHRAVAMGDYVDRLLHLETLRKDPLAGWSGKDTVSAYDDLNADYRKSSGSTRGLFDAGTVAAYGADTTAAIRHQQERDIRASNQAAKEAAKARDKALEESTYASGLEQMWNTQQWQLASLSDAPAKLREKVLFSKAQVLLDPSPQNAKEFERAAAAGVVEAGVSDAVKASIRNIVAGSVGAQVPGESFSRMYETWRQLSALRPAAAYNYFGADYDKQFAIFASVHPGPINPQDPGSAALLTSAFAASFGPNASNARRTLSADELKSYKKEIVGAITHVMPEFLGGEIDVEEHQFGSLLAKIKPTMESLAGIMPVEQAAQRALAAARQGGMQTVGGYVWWERNAPPLGKRVQDYLDTQAGGPGKGVSIDTGKPLGAAFRNVIAAKLQSIGATGAAALQPDGVGGFYVLASDKDNLPKNGVITLQEIADAAKTATLGRREVEKRVKTDGNIARYRPDKPLLEYLLPGSTQTK